ncbi:MAG TPA: hypothetical protein ENN69_08815, partial [Spirochaetia bacterium]|nr:hypothetical protein [Spirochaetia bacterium]
MKFHFAFFFLLTGFLLAVTPLIGQTDAREVEQLIGFWIWEEDEDGTVPVKDSVCTLALFKGGNCILNCFLPDFSMNGAGTFSVNSAASRITLHLPSFDISVTNAPYTLGNDTLTLPFSLIGEGDQSRWRRDVPPPAAANDLPAIAFRAFDQALLNGASPAEAAEAARDAVAQADLTVFGGGGGPPPLPSGVTLNPDKTMLKLVNKKGQQYYILLDPKKAGKYDFTSRPKSEPLSPSSLATDPRTQLFMKKSAGPDDPAHHRAAIFLPMLNQRSFTLQSSFTHQGWGEDPEFFKKYLLRAGYAPGDVTIITDTAVTPKSVLDELLKSPGLFYISSHGIADVKADGSPEYYLVTGMKIVPHGNEMVAQAFTKAIAALPLPARYHQGIGCMSLRTDRYTEEWFVVLTGDFFREVASQVDLSTSFVYIDACFSAKDPFLARILNVKAYAGWRTASDAVASIPYAKFIFSSLSRKSFSLREVFCRLGLILRTRRVLFKEDMVLDKENPYHRDLVVDSFANFVVLGSDGKPYPELGALYPGKGTADGVAWLLWLGRWNQDPEKGSENLRSCFDTCW